MSGKGDRSSHKTNKDNDKDRKKSYLSLIPISCYKVKEVIYEKLILSGQLPLFKHLMREKLYQEGWVYAYRLACQDKIKDLGVENVNVSHMMTDMLPKGRELFNNSDVKKQLQNLLRDFALMYFNSDSSALLPEYSSSSKNDVQYQSRDAKPEPRKRTHSHDHHSNRTHSSSKRSRSSSNRSNCRSRSRNRGDRSRSRSRSDRGRSSSGSGRSSGSHSGSRSRSPVRSPIPVSRPITPQPVTLPAVLRVERLMEPKIPANKVPPPQPPPPPIVTPPPAVKVHRPEPVHQAPPVPPQPPEPSSDETDPYEQEAPEEEEELPDI